MNVFFVFPINLRWSLHKKIVVYETITWVCVHITCNVKNTFFMDKKLVPNVLAIHKDFSSLQHMINIKGKIAT